MKETIPVTTLTSSLVTCVVGGGNSAHVLIPFLSEAGHQVNLLTRRPKDWNDVVYCHITGGRTGETAHTHAGQIHVKSDDPADVIPDADVIILCLPVWQYRRALIKVSPYVNRNKDVYIGTMYGQAGFNWMVHRDIEKAHNLENVVIFAIGNIPWICRTVEYGKRVHNYGGKNVNVVAVSPKDRFQKLNEIFLNDISLKPLGKGLFVLACSFLSLTLSVDNQIIHPARCYGLWKRYNGFWESSSDVPYFYRNFDKLSAKYLRKIDAEYTLVRNAIKKRFPHLPFTYMLSYLELEKLNHDSRHVDILSSFRDSKQLASIKTPVVQKSDGHCFLDSDFRFFKDDIPYGLLVAKSLAEMLSVETPFLAEVIEWAQKLRGETFIQNGKINREYCLSQELLCGIPEVYGITELKDVVE